MRLLHSKKGVIDQLQPMIIALVAIGVILAIGFLVIAEVKTQATAQTSATSLAVNATSEVQNALSDIPGWLPIIVITVIGALLIGLVALFRRR